MTAAASTSAVSTSAPSASGAPAASASASARPFVVPKGLFTLQLSLPLAVPVGRAHERMAIAAPSLWQMIVTQVVGIVEEIGDCIKGLPGSLHRPTCTKIVLRCFLSCVRACNHGRVWPSVEYILQWAQEHFPHIDISERSIERAIAFLIHIKALRRITTWQELRSGPGAYQFPFPLRRATRPEDTTPTYDISGVFDLVPDAFKQMVLAAVQALGYSEEEGWRVASRPPTDLAEISDKLPSSLSKTLHPPPEIQEAPAHPAPASANVMSLIENEGKDFGTNQAPEGGVVRAPELATLYRKRAHEGKCEDRNESGESERQVARSENGVHRCMNGDAVIARSAQQSPDASPTPDASVKTESEPAEDSAEESVEETASKREKRDVMRLLEKVNVEKTARGKPQKPMFYVEASKLIRAAGIEFCLEAVAYARWMRRRGTQIKNFGSYVRKVVLDCVALRDLSTDGRMPPWHDEFANELRRERARRVRAEQVAEDSLRAEAASRAATDAAIAASAGQPERVAALLAGAVLATSQPLAVERASRAQEAAAANASENASDSDSGAMGFPVTVTGPPVLVAIWPKFDRLLSKRLPRLAYTSFVHASGLRPIEWNERDLVAWLTCSEAARARLQTGSTAEGALFLDIFGEALRDALNLPISQQVRVRLTNESSDDGSESA